MIRLGLGPTFVGALSEFLATHQHLGKAAGAQDGARRRRKLSRVIWV
jgi:hypothetical protein